MRRRRCEASKELPATVLTAIGLSLALHLRAMPALSNRGHDRAAAGDCERHLRRYTCNLPSAFQDRASQRTNQVADVIRRGSAAISQEHVVPTMRNPFPAAKDNAMNISPATPPSRPESEKRALLVVAGTMGAAGLLAAAYPFVASLEPSARALAEGGPVEFDLGQLGAGQTATVAWRGKPVWIMKRTPAMVSELQRANPDLADPLSKRSEQPADCVNATRSVRPDVFVCVGICTHLGCSPTLRLDDAALAARLHAPDGYYCPCHGSVFDLAGRVIRNVPAPVNLVIPEHRFTTPTSLVIG
ncbi:MAG TPA: ubiquinol-cytochrome c reductase iron-sulfur subunit [Caldimonas sp.]|nr:ubiquinol-cytochrome c reductase iron-sulfur subunit [Caldimonas sp.]HEV7574857.1 ubiquinol-cytochrome c reductase iron-sulfur subunit [Caldimonas sp.]